MRVPAYVRLSLTSPAALNLLEKAVQGMILSYTRPPQQHLLQALWLHPLLELQLEADSK
jgi:hypothetical protein